MKGKVKSTVVLEERVPALRCCFIPGQRWTRLPRRGAVLTISQKRAFSSPASCWEPTDFSTLEVCSQWFHRSADPRGRIRVRWMRREPESEVGWSFKMWYFVRCGCSALILINYSRLINYWKYCNNILLILISESFVTPLNVPPEASASFASS